MGVGGSSPLVTAKYVGVAERFSGRLKPYDNGGSIPSSHTLACRLFKWMRVRSPWGTDHFRMVTNGGSNPAASTILGSSSMVRAADC